LRKAAGPEADADVRLRSLSVLARIDPPAPPRLIGKEMVLTGHTGKVIALDLSADGRWIASAGSDGLRPWDRRTGGGGRAWGGAPPTVWDVASSPDGRPLAAAGTPHFFALWDVATGRKVRNLGPAPWPPGKKGKPSGAVRSLAFTPDGKYVVVGT